MRDNFLVGILVAILLSVVAMAMLGWVDLDDTKTNINPPAVTEVTP